MSCAQGVATFISCNKAASIPIFSAYLAADPNDYYTRYYRGRAYEIIGNNDEAIADFKFLKKTSKGVENRVAEAKLIMLQQSPRHAVDFLITHVIGQYPQSELALSVLGEILVEQNSYDEAFPYLVQAVKIEHALIGSAYRDLGFIHKSRRDYKQAKHCFTIALQRHETMTHAHLGLAEALIGLGMSTEAEPHLAKAAELNPFVYSRYVSFAFQTKLDIDQHNAKKVASLKNRTYFMPETYGGQPNENIWYVKDTAGHAQCRYKVYIEHSGYLKFLFGADEFGKRIAKHESMTGHRIRVKDLSITRNS